MWSARRAKQDAGMVLFSHTFLVNDPESTTHRRIDAIQLWELMVHKAANPVSYVPSITKAEVLERFDDGFVRQIVLREEHTVRERIRLDGKRRIVFEQLDNPNLTQITNEIGEDEQGRLTFTLTATLSAAGVAKSRIEAGFIAENDLLFYDTARATVNTIRLTAATSS
jgi:hypothetical protein